MPLLWSPRSIDLTATRGDEAELEKRKKESEKASEERVTDREIEREEREWEGGKVMEEKQDYYAKIVLRQTYRTAQ